MTEGWDEMWREAYDRFKAAVDAEIERHADEIIDHITQNAAPMAYTREEIYSLAPDCSRNPRLVDCIVDKLVNIPTQYLIPTDTLRALLMRIETDTYGDRVTADTNALLAVLEVGD